jgi:uncharacterized membrane protein YgaE (UPF0421/DUF939 family)
LPAGLLAVLGVDVTRKKSLHSAFVRITSSIVGLLELDLEHYLAIAREMKKKRGGNAPSRNMSKV